MLTDEEKSGPQMVLDVCNVLVQSIQALKKELKEIYVDKELPLAERWYFFRNVPEELRENSQWCMSFENYDYECNDKFSTEYLYDCEDYIELEDDKMNALKEEILAAGFHSFTWDW